MKYDSLKSVLSDKLDHYRYKHALCVADEARRLAKKYGADTDDAYLAGLLHDITKCDLACEHLKIFDSFGIILSDIEKNSEKLWHAISGSVYVNKILKVNNDEIISAIRYHTTAKADMTLLELVLYLADFTSADRNYPDVDVMRNLVNKDRYLALKYALEYTIHDLESRNLPIHPDTLDAYNCVNRIIENRGEIK